MIVVVAGSITVDELVVDGQRRGRKLGGVPLYAGLTLRRHGITVRVVSHACREHAAEIQRVLGDADVVWLGGRDMQCTEFVNTIGPGDARSQELRSVAPPIRASDLRGALGEQPLVYVAPLHGQDVAEDVLTLLEGLRSRVVLDVQGLVRSGRIGVVESEVSPMLAPALNAASIVKASEIELEVVSDALGVDASGIVHRFGVEELIVTAAASGGRVYTPAAPPYAFPARPVAKVRDPTGAGDVFLAAYLIGRRSTGLTIEAACAGAAEQAARQVEGGGLVNRSLPGGQDGS